MVYQGQLLLLPLVLFWGCQRKPAYEPPVASRLDALHAQVLAGKGYADREKFKQLSELALLQFYRGEHQAAAATFDAAYQIMQDLYTRGLGQLAASKIVNENVKTFRGHYLEHWQWLALAVVNRLQAGDVEGAIVDTRRLSRQVRLKEDPFGEKRPMAVQQAYLTLTGTLLSILGSEEDGFSDLLAAWNMAPEKFDYHIRSSFKKWAYERLHEGRFATSSSDKNDQLNLVGTGDLKLNIHLRDQGPERIEKKISLTLFGFLPLIHDYMAESKDEKEAEHVTSIALGVLGQRMATLAYPVYRERTSSAVGLDGLLVPFSSLMMESWEAQKKRLIGQTALRVLLKIVASEKISDAVEGAVGNQFGWIVGNVSRVLVWETERADIRQILYLPGNIILDWDWVPSDKKVQLVETKVDRVGLF